NKHRFDAVTVNSKDLELVAQAHIRANTLSVIRNAHFLIISPGLPYHNNRAFSNIRSLKYRRKKHGYKFFYSDVSNTAHKLHHLLPPKGIQ
ncbi:hypothetical protein pdam_00008848, partial [Pocillopora damicornis]